VAIDLSRGLIFHENWESVFDMCSPEVRETYARLSITLGNDVVTRVLDERSNSVRDEVLVSLYPLAMWFAACWWRLRWESTPLERRQERPLSWRMSHELIAAGDGFAWPRLVFESDGESVVISAHQSNDAAEPIHYLTRVEDTIPAADFEVQVDRLISLVVSRLDARGINNSELHDLWSEVREERNDPTSTKLRRLEAELGFDPEEGPAEMMRRLEASSDTIGDAATDEVASALAMQNSPTKALDELFAATTQNGLVGRVEAPLKRIARDMPTNEVAWKQGWDLARTARKVLAFGVDPIDDEKLASVFGISAADLLDSGTAAPPLGLGVRKGDGKDLELYFRSRGLLGRRVGRRFDAARFLADAVYAPLEDRWLPLTDSKTARQKFQRAFAVEFLCPFESLKDKLAGAYSDEALDDAAEYFGVSFQAVRSLLANRGVISFESGY